LAVLFCVPIRLNFSHFEGTSFYTLDPKSAKFAKKRDFKQWVVRPPAPNGRWLQLPQSQRDLWLTAAKKLTGLSIQELQEHGVEVYDPATKTSYAA
jgi:hypothetical protein